MRVHLRQGSEVSENVILLPIPLLLQKREGRVFIRSKNPARLMQGNGRNPTRGRQEVRDGMVRQGVMAFP